MKRVQPAKASEANECWLREALRRVVPLAALLGKYLIAVAAPCVVCIPRREVYCIRTEESELLGGGNGPNKMPAYKGRPLLAVLLALDDAAFWKFH